MVGHIQSKRQQKKDRKKGGIAKKRTSLKMRKVKAPTELRVKRNKSKTFDEVLSTGRLTGRANSFLKSAGVPPTKKKRKTWWAGGGVVEKMYDGRMMFISNRPQTKEG